SVGATIAKQTAGSRLAPACPIWHVEAMQKAPSYIRDADDVARGVAELRAGCRLIDEAVEIGGMPPLRLNPAGLPGLLLHAGPPTEETHGRLDAAAAQLRAGGLEIEARIVEGPPAETLAHEMEDGAGDLLVMGAYGHSRLRTMMIGSTTSEMIRTQGVPVLVFR
ncbi:MAG: universal stress protein, partial [Pseudomonadota bacterium]